MKNNFPKIPLLVSFSFFFVTFLIFGFFFKQIKDNNRELQSKELAWRTEAYEREEIKTLDHSIKIIEAERIQLETHFAGSSDIVPFLNSIDNLSDRSRAQAEITEVNPLADNSGLFVGVKASGTFENIYTFLTLLENSAYEIEFIEVDMHKEIKNEAAVKIEMPKWNVQIKMNLLSFVSQIKN